MRKHAAKSVARSRKGQTATAPPPAPVEPRLAIEHVAPAALTPAPYNPRTISEEARAALMRGMQEFGLVDPIIARRTDGLVIGGHQRLSVAQEIGLNAVPVVYIDVDDARAAALTVLLNNPNAQGEWDIGVLSALLSDLDAQGFDATLTGFDDAELERLLTWLPEPLTEDEDESDPLPIPVTPVTLPGDLIALGRHRLLCGDARSESAWRTLLGEAKADMVWTDPPYGVAYVGKTADALRITNDDLDEVAILALLRASLALACIASKPGAPWYVASPGGVQMYAFLTALKELDIWRQTIQWVKDSMVLGHSDYHYRHEAVLYGWAPGAAHYFVHDRTLDTVWEIDRPKRSAQHPTMKPLELIKRAIRASSLPGGLIVDCFAGSGSTVIACEQTGRTCSAMELDPGYCDVIVHRWEQATGQTADRIG